MEFGLFVQAHVPRHEVEADPEGAEHSRLMRELELAGRLRPRRLEVRLVGRAPLPRGVLAPLGVGDLPALRRGAHEAHPRRLGDLQHHAAGQSPGAHRRARRHARSPERGPLRVRHRPRLVEHRVQGLRHPRRRHHARDVRRVAARDPAHVEARRAYSYEGTYFSMPERNVLPKPYSKPHPPLWVACGSPSTFEKAARLGLGALCFSLGSPKDFEPLIKVYKDTIKHAEPVGDYVNDNVACVTALVCLEDGKRGARRRARAWAAATTPASCSGTSTPSRARPACRRGRSSSPSRRAAQLEERIAIGPAHRRRPRRVRRGGAAVRRRRLRPDHLRRPRLDAAAGGGAALGRAVRPARASRASTRTRCTAPRACGRQRAPASGAGDGAMTCDRRRPDRPAGPARLRHAAAGRGAEHDVRRSRGRRAAGTGEMRRVARGVRPQRLLLPRGLATTSACRARTPPAMSTVVVRRGGDARLSRRRDHARCACCRTSGSRRTAIRSQTAKAFATLDALSGGRVILGVGAGHLEAEFAALGVDFGRRGALLDEAIDAGRRRVPRRVPGARRARPGRCATSASGPRPVQQPRPPIWVGGSTTAALRRAAERGDGWLPQGVPRDGHAGRDRVHPRAPRARARRRADRDRHERAVALRRHAVLRRRARTPAPARRPSWPPIAPRHASARRRSTAACASAAARATSWSTRSRRSGARWRR